jgi:hypothetical protein
MRLALTLYGRFVRRDTEANRQAVMESIERTLKAHNGSFPEKGDMFIEPEKRESPSPESETP